MRVLFDIVHPAHVHFYRHLLRALEEDGHETRVVARDKDVTLELLRAYGIEHSWTGRAGQKSALGRAGELFSRDAHLLRVAQRFRPDVVLTRNPSGVHAGRLVGAVTIFDSVDGRAAGVHFRLGAPLADVITSPNWLDEDYGPRHRRYRGPKELAYLHPARFTPDPGVRRDLGMEDDESLVVVRFVAHDAVHDTATVGLTGAAQLDLVNRLRESAHIVISSESPLPPELRSLAFDLGPERIHDVLAAADLYVGDSGSMAAEAGVLGTRAIRLSSWAGPVHGYLGQMQREYDLVENFTPTQMPEFVAAVDAACADLSRTKRAAQASAARLVADTDDVTAWHLDLLRTVTAVARDRWRRLPVSALS